MRQLKQLLWGALVVLPAMSYGSVVEQEVLVFHNHSDCRLVLGYQHQVIDKDHKMRSTDWPGHLPGEEALSPQIESGADGEVYIGFTEYASQIINEAQYAVQCPQSQNDVIDIHVSKFGGMKPIVEVVTSGRGVIALVPQYRTLPWREGGAVNVNVTNGPLFKAAAPLPTLSPDETTE